MVCYCLWQENCVPKRGTVIAGGEKLRVQKSVVACGEKIHVQKCHSYRLWRKITGTKMLLSPGVE